MHVPSLATLTRRIPGPIWALTLGIGCVMLVVAPGSATAGTVIHVSSATAQVNQTSSSNVTVSLAAADSMNGFDITVSFSPGVATVSGISLSPGWTQLTSTFDNVGGSIHVAGFQLGTGCGAGSSCNLFAINWLALTAGDSVAHVTLQQLAGMNSGSPGTLVNVAATDGGISVSAGSTVTTSTAVAPTSTPTGSPQATTTTPPTANTTTPTVLSTTTAAPTAASSSVTTPAASPVASPTSAAAQTTVATPTTSAPAVSATSSVAATQPSAATASVTLVPAVVATTPASPSANQTGVAKSPVPLGGSSTASTPRPPAAGSGITTYQSATDPLRLGGLALVLVSASALALHGLAGVRHRRIAAAPRSIDEVRDSDHSFVTVVDRYLDRVESAAHLEDEDPESRGSS